MSENRIHIICTSAVMCLVAVLLALCICPVSDADSEVVYKGEVVIDKDTVLPDGSSVVFSNFVVITLKDAVLDLGKGSSASVLGTMRIDGSGTLVLGEGTTVSFGKGVFTVPEGGITISIDGVLLVVYGEDVASSSVSLTYSQDGGDLRISSVSDNTQYLSVGKLNLKCQYTENAQKAFDRFVNDPSFGVKELVAAMGSGDYFSLSAVFDTLTYEVRQYDGDAYTYKAVTMSSADGESVVRMKVDKGGIDVVEFDPDRFVVSRGSSGSAVVEGYMFTGIKAPEISINLDLSITVSTGADEIGVFRSGDSSAYYVYMKDASFRLDTKLGSIFTIFERSGSINVSASTVLVDSKEGPQLLFKDVSVTGTFDSGVFSELAVSATYGETEFKLTAKGFAPVIKENDDGTYDVRLEISEVVIGFGRYTLTLTKSSVEVFGLNVYELLQRLQSGSFTIQGLLDSSDHSKLVTEKIGVESGKSAVMDGVVVLLARESGLNMISVTLGSFTGTVEMDSEYFDVAFSPSSLKVLSDCSLSEVFGSLVDKVHFAADAHADFFITTEKASVSHVTLTEDRKYVTRLLLSPDAGSISFAFAMDYSKSEDRLTFASAMDLSATTLDIANYTVYGNTDYSSSVMMHTHGAVGNIQISLTVPENKKSRISVTSEFASDVVFQVEYFGVFCDISLNGSTNKMKDTYLDVLDYDYRENGALSLFLAASVNDLHGVTNITTQSSSIVFKSYLQVVSSYTDASVEITDATLDLKRGDTFRFALGKAVIQGKDSGGKEYSKTINHFVISKNLAPESEEPAGLLNTIAIAVMVAAVLVWAAIIHALVMRTRNRA